MRTRYHSHSLCGPTSYNDGHLHHFGAVTEMAPSGVPHIHRFRGVTTYIDGHAHRFFSETGPAITAENGGHYHEYHAVTQLADGHTHRMRGYTSVD
jgi:UDP-2,3-diacylglucosamine pyrophosphatase LpxH